MQIILYKISDMYFLCVTNRLEKLSVQVLGKVSPSENVHDRITDGGADLRLKQETAEDGMARLQSKFQNFNAKVNQNVGRRTYGQHQSITRNGSAIQPKSQLNLR